MQCAMEEDDIPKTAFRAGSGGLFGFTMMPCGLCNAASHGKHARPTIRNY